MGGGGGRGHQLWVAARHAELVGRVDGGVDELRELVHDGGVAVGGQGGGGVSVLGGAEEVRGGRGACGPGGVPAAGGGAGAARSVGNADDRGRRGHEVAGAEAL